MPEVRFAHELIEVSLRAERMKGQPGLRCVFCEGSRCTQGDIMAPPEQLASEGKEWQNVSVGAEHHEQELHANRRSSSQGAGCVTGCSHKGSFPGAPSGLVFPVSTRSRKHCGPRMR